MMKLVFDSQRSKVKVIVHSHLSLPCELICQECQGFSFKVKHPIHFMFIRFVMSVWRLRNTLKEFLQIWYKLSRGSRMNWLNFCGQRSRSSCISHTHRYNIPETPGINFIASGTNPCMNLLEYESVARRGIQLQCSNSSFLWHEIRGLK